MTATVSPVFHRMLVASQIEAQARKAMKKWFPTYLREVERQLGLPKSTFAAPENYSERNSFDMEAAEKLPKIVVLSPGLATSPRKKGNWTYEATWRLGIGIAVGERTEEQASQAVKAYAAAIRGIMLQNSGMANLNATDIAWTDESYDDLPVNLPNQLVKAASLYFDIDITDVATRGHGPLEPDLGNYIYGEAETADIILEKVEEVVDSGD